MHDKAMQRENSNTKQINEQETLVPTNFESGLVIICITLKNEEIHKIMMIISRARNHWQK
jgi:hypothetical protein